MRTPTTNYELQGIDWKAENEFVDQYDHPEFYLSDLMQERINYDKTLSEHDKMIIQYLAMRKFHIPGNSFWEDYRFWFSNNHPFLCFCLADPRHPLGKPERYINLVATLAFGLAATCSVVLWFDYHEEHDFDKVIIPIPGFHVTIGMIMLMAFGGPLHVVFDLGLYFLQACPPCRAGGIFEKYFPRACGTCWLWIGAHFAFLITVTALTLAIQVALIRASINDDGNDEGISTDYKSYSFMLLYLLEVFVANFIVFPIGTLTVFSGVLGCCGRLPGLGGRPYQVRKHERMMQKQAAKARRSPVRKRQSI